LPDKLKEAISMKILKNLDVKGFQEFERTSLTVEYVHKTIKFDYTTGNYYSPIEVIAVNEEPSAPAVFNGGKPLNQLFSMLKRSLHGS
jgi:hypothetical protein